MSIEIPDLPLEEYEIPEEQEDEVKDESGGSIRYAFIGSGQAGGRLAEAFYNLDYKKVLCVNTAQHDLNTLKVPDEHKVHLDIGEQGAGKNMEKGENATQQYQQEIYDKMKRIFGNVDRVIVCAGLGGGTGGGSVLVLVDTARKYLSYIGCSDPETHVGVIATLPTSGETASPKVANNARIQKLYPRLTVKQFWPTVNATVAGLFHTFNVITTQDSQYSTFDPADYSSIVNTGGCMIMGLTNVRNFQTETDISYALKSNLGKTLLADGFDLATAKGAAAIVIGGSALFESVPGLMNAIEYGFDTIANLTGNCTVHRGIYETEKEKLTVYTLLSGLASPVKRIQQITRMHDSKNLYNE